MISKLVAVLETTLSKLGRYDEGSLIGSILSFTVSITQSADIKSLRFHNLILAKGNVDTQQLQCCCTQLLLHS